MLPFCLSSTYFTEGSNASRGVRTSISKETTLELFQVGRTPSPHPTPTPLDPSMVSPTERVLQFYAYKISLSGSVALIAYAQPPIKDPCSRTQRG